MSTKLMKFALAATVALGASAVMAQEFGEGISASVSQPEKIGSFVQSADGAMSQDQNALDGEKEKITIENSSVEMKPSEVLSKLMASEDMSLYDPKTGRILVLSKVTFDVRNPKVSSDFIEERVYRMTELLMNAKGEIVKTICSKMSAERVLDLPANPIRNQLQKEEDEIKKQVEYTKELLEKAGIAVEEAKFDTKRLTVPELMGTLADICKSDYITKLDAEKKAEFEAATNEYSTIKRSYDALVKKAEECQADFREKLQQQRTASIKLSAGMQIHGCVIIEQAEGAFVKNGKWKYEIAALYSWSKEAQDAAHAILSAKKVTFNKGSKTIGEWVSHYAKIPPEDGGLADWMGSRRYTDKYGDMWYLGIYPSVVVDNEIDNAKNLKAAALMARAEVGYALYSDFKTEEALEQINLDFKDDNGETISKTLKDYSQKTIESFKDLVFFGLGPVGGPYLLKHSTGHDINVVVYGINASNAKTMRDIQRNAHKLGLKINTYQEYERGRQEDMSEQTRASRNNPAARDAGRDGARAETEEALHTRAKPTGMRRSEAESSNSNTMPKRLKKGTRFIRATDDF